MSDKTCDHASVGVVITATGYPGVPDDHVFCIKRATDPPGWASVAGHVFDEHATYTEAAIEEVHQESGLRVVTLNAVSAEIDLPNACRRNPGPDGHWHRWRLFEATVTGEPNPSKRETSSAGWRSPDQLQRLADRSMRYVRGERTYEQFKEVPGLELVWVELFARIGLISMSQSERDAALAAAAIPPGKLSR